MHEVRNRSRKRGRDPVLIEAGVEHFWILSLDHEGHLEPAHEGTFGLTLDSRGEGDLDSAGVGECSLNALARNRDTAS